MCTVAWDSCQSRARSDVQRRDTQHFFFELTRLRDTPVRAEQEVMFRGETHNTYSLSWLDSGTHLTPRSEEKSWMRGNPESRLWQVYIRLTPVHRFERKGKKTMERNRVWQLSRGILYRRIIITSHAHESDQKIITNWEREQRSRNEMSHRGENSDKSVYIFVILMYLLLYQRVMVLYHILLNVTCIYTVCSLLVTYAFEICLYVI